MIRKYGLDPGTKMVDHDNKNFLKAYFATGCDSIFIPDIVKKLKKNWIDFLRKPKLVIEKLEKVMKVRKWFYI